MPASRYRTRPLDQSLLVQLLIAYFHEDWRLDDPTESAVILRFVNHSTSSEMAGVVGDIDEVLAEWDDQAVRDLVGRHLANIALGERDLLSWLQWLRATLVAAVQGAQAPE